MNLKKMLEQDLNVPEGDSAPHSFVMALKCVREGMPNRASSHLRAALRSTVDNMVESDDRDTRKLWHQCYLTVEAVWIELKREYKLV